MLTVSAKIRIFSYFLILTITNKALPNNSDSTAVIPPISNYLSSRSLGMGDSNVAVANDENSIFHNPAGIAIVNATQKSLVKAATLPNISYSTNSYTYGLINQNYNYYNYPYNLIDKAVKDTDKNNIIFSRISIFPTVILGYFQFGILADSYESGYTTLLQSPQNSSYTTGTYDRTFTEFRRDQEGIVTGLSIPIAKSFIFGFSARIMQRDTKTNTIEANQYGLIPQAKSQAENNINSTTGTAIDLGIIMPFKSALSPKLGFSVLDVGDTTYQAANSFFFYRKCGTYKFIEVRIQT